METLKLYAKIGEYEETLKFIQDELMEDRKKLAEIKKSRFPDQNQIDLVQHEIELFEQAVDEYQSKIQKLRKNAESICTSQI